MYKDMKEILAAVAAGELSPEQADALIESLEKNTSSDTAEPAEGCDAESIEDLEARVEQQAMKFTESIMRTVEKALDDASGELKEAARRQRDV